MEINLNPGVLKMELKDSLSQEGLPRVSDEVFDKIWNDLREIVPFVTGQELDPENPRHGVHPHNDAYDYHI